MVGHYKPSTIARVLALFAQVVDAGTRRLIFNLPARQSPTIASYVRAAERKAPTNQPKAGPPCRADMCLRNATGQKARQKPGEHGGSSYSDAITRVIASLRALLSGFAASSLGDCSSCGYEPSSQGLSLNRSHRKMLY